MSSKAQVFSLTQNHFHGSRKEVIFILLSKCENNICCASPGTHKKDCRASKESCPSVMVSSTASTSTVHVLQTVASSQGKGPETAPTAHIVQPKIT